MTPPLSAALDIGSNSVHLLVARQDPGPAPVPLVDISRQAGIGRAVDETGALGAELRELLVVTVEGYAVQARELGAETVLVLGTESLRQASDTPDLADTVRARTGLPTIVLDYASEALLTLLGVTGGAVAGPLAVVDIGGGSTEVTVARPGAAPAVGILPVGSARLAALYVRHDPVTEDEVATLRVAARVHVAELDVPRPDRVIVSGGSGTNVSRLLGRERATPVDRAAIDEALRLLRSQAADVLAVRTGLTTLRIAQLAAGLAIGEALLDRFGLEVAEVSDASLREGALIANWLAGDDWLAALLDIVGGRP